MKIHPEMSAFRFYVKPKKGEYCLDRDKRDSWALFRDRRSEGLPLTGEGRAVWPWKCVVNSFSLSLKQKTRGKGYETPTDLAGCWLSE